MGNRRKGRECALQIMYQLETQALTAVPPKMLGSTSKANIQTAAHDFFTHFDAQADVHQHATSLVEGTLAHLEKIDEAIQQHSQKWKIERMSRIDRNVIRIATYELIFAHELPTRVVLDEAIEIAKRFGGEHSGTFANGILDAIAKTVRKNTP